VSLGPPLDVLHRLRARGFVVTAVMFVVRGAL
jgi:hypothetical protein